MDMHYRYHENANLRASHDPLHPYQHIQIIALTVCPLLGINKSELRSQHRSYSRLRYQPRLTPGWVLLEVATVAFM